MILRPCLKCGLPSPETYCPDHTPTPTRTDTSEWQWMKLSRKARRLQPFCLICGDTSDLQLDHSPRAWARKRAGLPIRLLDCQVLCRTCNVEAGSSKPGSARWNAWHAEDGGDLHSTAPDRSAPNLATVGAIPASEAVPLARQAARRFISTSREVMS